MPDQPESNELLALTANIVASHVSNNAVSVTDLPHLIQQVYSALLGVSSGTFGATGPRPQPAVPIKKSITPDYVICLEDGKKLKMLKRHIKTRYNLTPDQYRERWGLGADYPMVAPNYAAHRSKLAKKIGLGTKRRTKRRRVQ